MKIGYTGTQRGMTSCQVIAVCELLIPGEFHHGDCIGGDAQAHKLAQDCGLSIVQHPPLNPSKRAWCKGGVILEPKPYLERNQDIVKATEVLIAAPGEDHERLRSGTWSTVRFARKLKRLIWLVLPDGHIVIEKAGMPVHGLLFDAI